MCLLAFHLFTILHVDAPALLLGLGKSNKEKSLAGMEKCRRRGIHCHKIDLSCNKLDVDFGSISS